MFDISGYTITQYFHSGKQSLSGGPDGIVTFDCAPRGLAAVNAECLKGLRNALLELQEAAEIIRW